MTERNDGVTLDDGAFDVDLDVRESCLERARERLELFRTPDRLRSKTVRDGLGMQQPIDSRFVPLVPHRVEPLAGKRVGRLSHGVSF
jgi:hypothetical protein